MKHLNKAIITLSVCAFLLCGCGKEEETVVETIVPTPEPVQSTIEVQIEPDVTIEEHKAIPIFILNRKRPFLLRHMKQKRRVQSRR